MAEIERISAPSAEQFAEAAQVNYERTPFQRTLDSPERFRGFQKLGVELAVFRSAQRMEAVACLLPASLAVDGGAVNWVYMFEVAGRASAPGAGALLLRKVMEWYPAILGIGITPDAVRIYEAFKWTHHGKLWRAVHPLRLDRMLDDYGYRLKSRVPQPLQSAGAGLYNLFAGGLESLLASGATCERWKPSGGKAAVVADYLRLYRAGDLTAADVGGAGRIGNAPARIPHDIRQHAALWRAMRQDGLKFCEMLVPNAELKGQAARLGYWPMELPVWYWDRNRVMAPVLEKLGRGEISFLETDKVV